MLRLVLRLKGMDIKGSNIRLVGNFLGYSHGFHDLSNNIEKSGFKPRFFESARHEAKGC